MPRCSAEGVRSTWRRRGCDRHLCSIPVRRIAAEIFALRCVANAIFASMARAICDAGGKAQYHFRKNAYGRRPARRWRGTLNALPRRFVRGAGEVECIRLNRHVFLTEVRSASCRLGAASLQLPSSEPRFPSGRRRVLGWVWRRSAGRATVDRLSRSGVRSRSSVAVKVDANALGAGWPSEECRRRSRSDGTRSDRRRRPEHAERFGLTDYLSARSIVHDRLPCVERRHPAFR
jgi:hypothetical protein